MQDAFFFRREIRRAKFTIDIGVLPAATGVKLHNLLERRETPIVHVGRGSGDLAQRWCFEGSSIALLI